MEAFVHLIRGVFGVVVLIGLAWLASSNRRQINWKLVGIGIGLQVVFALLVLKTAPGRWLFELLGSGFAAILGHTQAGSDFLFGPLAQPPGAAGSIGFVFATQILPTIVFFASLMGLLYYLGLVQPLVRAMGKFMAKTLGISGAESLSAAANVFVGQTEAPLVVKPYVDGLTQSELMTLMVGGMATIAGGVLAAYVTFLGGESTAEQALFAGHLLSASIMSAPAAIVMAKILVPETGTPETIGVATMDVPITDANALEAAAGGAADGLKLALNVGAMLLAFLALLSFANAILGWIGHPNLFGFRPWNLNALVASASGGQFDSLSLEAIFGYLFAPLAWSIGVEAADMLQFGRLLGEKVAVNELVAYASLAELKGIVSDRTIVIGTYALCGFANFSSIAIQIGGIGGIAPGRRSDIAALGVKSVIGGALASWMTATIAGVLVA